MELREASTAVKKIEIHEIRCLNIEIHEIHLNNARLGLVIEIHEIHHETDEIHCLNIEIHRIHHEAHGTQLKLMHVIAYLRKIIVM